MLDVSCIYINYNSASFTIDAIKSLVEQTKETVNYEIVVVDNGSVYADYELLRNSLESLEFNSIRIYRSRVNTGFGAGNMMGVNFALPSRYYAFINNDTLIIQENTLKDLKQFMDSTKDAGICGPQMMSENLEFISSIDHHATPARQLLKRDVLEFINPTRYPKRKKRYSSPVSCGYVPGSFMFVKSSAFDEIGGFDTAIFLFYEESDLCRRMEKKLALKTYHIPYQQYIHYQGKSTNKNLSIKVEQKISLLYLIKKHHGRLPFILMRLFYTLKYAITAIFSKKKRQLFWELIKGATVDQSLRCRQQVVKR